MVEEIATVVATESDGVWLTTTPAGSCNSCQVSGDCGTGIVAKTLTPRQRRFFVKSALPLLPGEQVRIGVAEQGLVTAALLVYLLPLLLMIASVTLLHTLWQLAEVWLLLAAVIALYSGFRLAKHYDQRLQHLESVQILQVLPQLSVRSD
jgi:sigma-E factor negative regulatory protein RseC